MLTNISGLNLWISWMTRGAEVNGDWQRGPILHDTKWVPQNQMAGNTVVSTTSNPLCGWCYLTLVLFDRH